MLSPSFEDIVAARSNTQLLSPVRMIRPTLLTEQETSQPNRVAVDYWATGLEAVYFEGAFDRAK